MSSSSSSMEKCETTKPHLVSEVEKVEVQPPKMSSDRTPPMILPATDSVDQMSSDGRSSTESGISRPWTSLCEAVNELKSSIVTPREQSLTNLCRAYFDDFRFPPGFMSNFMGSISDDTPDHKAKQILTELRNKKKQKMKKLIRESKGKEKKREERGKAIEEVKPSDIERNLKKMIKAREELEEQYVKTKKIVDEEEKMDRRHTKTLKRIDQSKNEYKGCPKR